MYEWGGITFAAGLALVVLDVVFASKKKEGVTVADKKRIKSLFWLTCIMTALVAGLIWMAE